MSPLTTDERRRRDQFEGLIRLAEPYLNAILRVGDRISRLVEPEDSDYYPPRPAAAGGTPPPEIESPSERPGE